MKLAPMASCLILLLSLWLAMGLPNEAPTQSDGESEIGIQFVDRALEAGLKHQTIYGDEDRNRYLLETTGAGVALIDYDGDGWLDIFFVNGSRLGGFPVGEEPVSRLYRNNRNGTFTDVTEHAGVGRHGWGQAVCAGDFDNDGWIDLFVTYWGQNVLYRNRGDGTFEDVTEASLLLQDRRRWNTGCAFVDYDRDGHLDLFVANYIDFEPENTPTPDSGLCLYKGTPVACGPPGLPGGKNILYRNRGDGTFEDVSAEAGILDAEGTYALGVVAFDFDNDGWPDIYVANDSNPSALYRNNRDGTFTDIGVLAGCALSQDGKPQAGMGVSVGDFNRSGFFDVFKTNFAGDTSNLYRNLGNGFFEEAAFSTGVGVNTRWLGWGCGFVDLNLNGWLDIFEVNGHVYPEVRNLESEAKYRQPKVVYMNRAGVRFEDVTGRLGGPLLEPKAGRGAAFGDLDNDGDVDVVVNNVNDFPSLYINESRHENRWIALDLEGVRSNRSAIGARVILRAGEVTMIDEVRSGGSYFSQNDMRVRFGLGQAEMIDEVEIRWPSGQVDHLVNPTPNQIFKVREGAFPAETDQSKSNP